MDINERERENSSVSAYICIFAGMKINFVKEDPRVKAAHEEFIKQNPQFAPTEEDKKKDRVSTIGCLLIVVPIFFTVFYTFLIWVFDWYEGVTEQIDNILLYGFPFFVLVGSICIALIEPEGRLKNISIYIFLGIISYPLLTHRSYKAISELVTGDTQVAEGTFQLSGQRPHIIFFDSCHSRRDRDKRRITNKTYERVKNAHIIRMVYWKHSGVVQSVEVISEKPVSNTGVE